MKVLLVNGSPNQKGCTNRALEEMESQFHKQGIETEYFWIGNQALSGCLGCGYCGSHGKCVFDDKVNAFVEKAKEADGFVFGTPVHYASMAGNFSSFLDRVFYSTFSQPEIFRLKPACGIVSARRAGTTATYDQLNKYLGMNQMPIISSRYWNMVHGNTPKEVEQDKEGLQVMRILANNMAYSLKCIEAGKEKGIEKPEVENVQLTNFIR